VNADQLRRLPASRPNTAAIVQIGSYQSILRFVERAGPPISRTLLVVDECHRVGTPSHRKLLGYAYPATLGLSATPEREHDDWFQEFVVPGLGPVIFQYDLKGALADGLVSPFTIKNLRVPLSDREQREIDALTRSISRAISMGDEDRAKALLLRRQRSIVAVRSRLPAAAYLAKVYSDRRTVVFHEDNQSADILLRLLLASGLSATIYHSGLSPKIRASNLLLYRKHMFEILVCCRALDEGLNVPDTSCAILAASSRSHRQRVQRLGRILRPSRGKGRALVATLYATDVEQRALETEARTMAATASSIEWGNITVRG
jgi:superfamily II DNA or RNA helicase